MKISYALIILLVTSCNTVIASECGSCTESGSACERRENPATEKLRRAALEGSADAALELQWMCSDDGNIEQAVAWARVGMENGSEAGKYNYASFLADRCDLDSLLRARYFLKRLIEQGDADAKVLLKKVETKLGRMSSACPSKGV